jgi:hypothetical protein
MNIINDFKYTGVKDFYVNSQGFVSICLICIAGLRNGGAKYTHTNRDAVLRRQLSINSCKI